MATDRSDETFRRVRELTTRLIEFGLSDSEKTEFERLLGDNPELRDWYVDHMAVHGMLRYAHLQPLDGGLVAEDNGAKETGLCEIPVDEAHPARPTVRDSRSPILGLLGDVFQAGTDFLSRSIVLTLLLAVGLPGVLLLILVLQVSRQSLPAGPVAAVTQTHECVWGEGTVAMLPGKNLFAGEQLELAKGFVEVTFGRGGKVLLQGPATFNVTDDTRGFLHEGCLVARVNKGARGFAIQTPVVTVVDFGTEFGVRVEDERGNAQIEVFQGNVELRTTAKEKRGQTVCEQLAADQAARVELADQQGAQPIIRRVTPVAGSFVRQIPSPPPKPEVVADFSGGAGNSQPDQFPGAVGAGWATGWDVRGVAELACAASIDEANPMLGGGKYMRVLMERKPGGANKAAWAGVDRRVESEGPVDLTKRYTVSFNVRVDTLARLSKSTDRLSICSRAQSQAEHAITEAGSTIGWFVSIARNRAEPGEPAQWFLYYRGAGKLARISSGISVREGAVYSFRILVDPQAGQWTPSIAVDGGPWTAFSPMSMRSAKTAEENRYWPYWHCYWLTHFGKEGGVAEKMELSVDSLRVVPE